MNDKRWEPIYEALDGVDSRMKYLGIALNLLDPNGTFKGMPSEELLLRFMVAIREDYRYLSDAIHGLRKEIDQRRKKR